MNNLWIALSIYAALALATAGGLWLYLSVRAELKKVRALVARSEQEPPRTPTGFQRINYTRRTEILRLDRQGEPPGTIAAALNLPVLEVELALKINRLRAGA